jgi:hypothetical protein
LNTVRRNERSTVVAVAGAGAVVVAARTFGSDRSCVPAIDAVEPLDGVDDDVVGVVEVELEFEPDPQPTAMSALTRSAAAPAAMRAGKCTIPILPTDRGS